MTESYQDGWNARLKGEEFLLCKSEPWKTGWKTCKQMQERGDMKTIQDEEAVQMLLDLGTEINKLSNSIIDIQARYLRLQERLCENKITVTSHVSCVITGATHRESLFYVPYSKDTPLRGFIARGLDALWATDGVTPIRIIKFKQIGSYVFKDGTSSYMFEIWRG